LLDLREQLSFLYRLAKSSRPSASGARQARNFNRPDYNFRLHGNDGAEPRARAGADRHAPARRAAGPDRGRGRHRRQQHLGQLLAELGVPGIYRSQASMAPGVKVRMGTKALPHAGIGVKSYAWATSPLRRYTDLVNQWQIIACARHGKTAALAAPFKPKDADLFSIISSFDAAYSAYNGYQAGMERFWTLKYLEQNGITELEATVFKEGPGGSFLVRADDAAAGLPGAGRAKPAARRAPARALGEVDEIALDVHGTVIERLDDPADPSDDGPVDESRGRRSHAAGPIAIAVDVNEPEAGASTDNPSP
jgi:exoribonuclease-2